MRDTAQSRNGGYPTHDGGSRAARGRMDRRTLLVSMAAATAVGARPRLARAGSAIVLPGPAANRRFSVFYKGDRIGAHTISYSAETGQTRVTTAIDLAVKALFLTVFAFRHRSEEVWRGGRLMSLSGETQEHGQTISVTGTATPEGFRVVTGAGPFLAASSALTSNSLWTQAVLAEATVIDAQHGGVIGVSAHRVGSEQIVLAGRPVRTTRFHFITPYLAGSIWYDDSGLWVRGEFERDAASIEYQLDA